MRKLHHLMLSLLLLCALGSVAQTRAITGKILDASGSPIPFASIHVKGSKTGVSAGSDGNFSISVSPNATLIVSGIGFETKEIKVGTLQSFEIHLNSDSKALSEVVVTGTGTATSKKKLGIAVQSVTADKLPQAPTASLDQALIGKIPGAQISSASGNPGDPVNIVLRGINTVQGGTKPLIVMDGVEIKGTDINSLDLSNVERVEVVQGAASAAIYGAQGANGVIQIFTKKGRKGMPSINYSGSYATVSFLNTGNVHKSMLHPYLTDANNNIIDKNGKVLAIDQTNGNLFGISYTYGGATRYGILNNSNINDKPYNANLKYYDHFKQVFLTGYTANHSISISGGGDKTDYAITASTSHSLSPVMKNGYLDRSNLTVNYGAELFKGFKLRSITQMIYTRNTMHPGLGGPGGYLFGKGNYKGSIGGVYSFLNTSPFFSLTQKMDDGNYPGYQKADYLSVNAFNPYYRQEYTQGLDNKIDLIQNFDASYRVNKFLELDVKYGINWRNENARWTYFNQSENANSAYWLAQSSNVYTGNFAVDNTGEIDNWQYNNTFQNFLPSATVKTDFQKDFNLKLPIQTSTYLAFDYRKNYYREFDTYGLGLPLDPPISIASSSTQAVAPYNDPTHSNGDYREPFITYGYVFNQNIDYGDLGGITAGFRSDYSSAFGGGSKPFTFPHFSAYFLPSSLDFWKDGKASEIVPYFKLRGAFGKAGIQPGPFDRYPNIVQSNLGSGLVYSNPTSTKDAALNVEVSKETELGTDFTVNLNKNGTIFNHINGSFSYWSRSSSNVIYDVPLALSSGSTEILNNAIDMHSKGYEFSLNLSVVQSKNFTWDFTTNFGHQMSMIDRITGGIDIPLTSGAGDGGEALVAGQKIGQIYGYKTLRSVSAKKSDGSVYVTPGTEGNYAVVNNTLIDTATKGIMFAGEITPLGDPNPKFNMSFIHTLSYKDFLTFSFQFDWVYGSHLYNQTKEWMYRDGISGDFDKPVTINGTKAAYTAYWASAYYGLWGSAHGAGNDATKDFFMESASFLRLRNVALGMDFAKIMKIKAVKKLQLVLTGRNIWTHTKYSGYDPEVSSGSVNSSFDRGVDHSTLPNTKSYQVGLNVGF